jgi:hypothetical protein
MRIWIRTKMSQIRNTDFNQGLMENGILEIFLLFFLASVRIWIRNLGLISLVWFTYKSVLRKRAKSVSVREDVDPKLLF